MWEKQPVKAIANGEPTYENIGAPGRAAGWWQGHEAWNNLTAGGTMGVVYGAGSLWQWRLDAQEVHEAWCMASGAGWREALDFEGATYVGIISRVFEGLPFGGMAPDYPPHLRSRRRLIVPGKFFIVYLPDGGVLANRADAQRRSAPKLPCDRCPERRRPVASGEGHDPIATITGMPCVVIFSDLDE